MKEVHAYIIFGFTFLSASIRLSLLHRARQEQEQEQEQEIHMRVMSQINWMDCPFEFCAGEIPGLPDPYETKDSLCEWACPKCGAAGTAERGEHFSIGTGVPGHDYRGYHWAVKTIRECPGGLRT